MKFDYEKLEQLKEDMNELYDKCAYILNFISKEFETQIKLTKKTDDDLHRSLRWKELKNPFYEDYVFIMGEDNDFYLESDGVKVVGKSPNYEDSSCDECEYLIPFEWLELDGQDLDSELTHHVTQVVGDYVGQYYERKRESEKREQEKLKEAIGNLSKEEILKIINRK